MTTYSKMSVKRASGIKINKYNEDMHLYVSLAFYKFYSIWFDEDMHYAMYIKTFIMVHYNVAMFEEAGCRAFTLGRKEGDISNFVIYQVLKLPVKLTTRCASIKVES